MSIRRERRNRLVPATAIAGYLAIGVFPYLVSGLLVPPGAVAILMACWAVGLVTIAHLARRRPMLTPVPVVLAVLFWFAFVTAGSALFGWTA